MNKSSPRGLVTGSTTFEQPLVVREGLTIDSNSEQHLHMQWQQRPQQVLIVAKPGDRLVNATLQDMTAWLSSQSITVILEPKLLANLSQSLGRGLSKPRARLVLVAETQELSDKWVGLIQAGPHVL